MGLGQTVLPRRTRTAALASVLAASALLAAALPAHARTRDPLEARGLGAATSALTAAAELPAGFTESVAFSGLTNPTAVRFAPDGRVFVAEKGGRIKVFDSLADPTATVWADLSTKVHDFWDRGLLGLALDPNFASRPYVYALYAYDKAPNSSQQPRWGDACATPPGPTDDGCTITGRLSRLSAGGVETVLIEDFCQQYPSHSVGSLAFGPDGALYVSAGDGASFNWADYGQDGNPLNPCGDPPAGAGGTMTPPTAEGGALRSQDIRTTGDPTALDGAILRVDPDTGAALAGNPNGGSPDVNTRRIVAHGLRNPFRIAVRPGTNEVWAGDVGWNTWEEIDRVQSPTGGTTNFGWPCYEGAARQSAYDSLNLNVCENLYAAGSSAWTPPYYTYNHSAKVVTGETCPTGGSSISGLAFYTSGSFGPAYDGALFFSDYSRNCIWVMFAGANGLPDPATRQTFIAAAQGPVELQIGPEGDLYYVDMGGGTIRRVRGTFTNQTPTAVATATPTSGAVPLTVSFDGRGSSDPDGDTLTYAWDLDGDGVFTDSTSPTPSRTYTSPTIVTVGLRVTDTAGLTDTDTVTVTAGAPPTAAITSPIAGTTWRVGDTIGFSGTGTNSQGQALPASSLTWRLNLEHCNRTGSSCHTHVVQSFTGASGSFVAPDHEYPSYLELQLTATDGFGLTRTVTRRLDPRTVPITVQSDPAGVDLTLGTETAAAPYTLDVIQGSHLALTAPSSATVGGWTYEFSSWSDGGARTHEIVAGTTAATYTATFARTTTPSLIAGTDVIGQTGSDATAGRAEAYRTTAAANGRATAIRIRLAPTSNSSAVVLGLYADASGQPTTLLASGRLNTPQAGAWNEVALDAGPTLTAGTPYWIGLLNPAGATGVLRWHDRAGGTGGAEQGSASATLAALPATWARGAVWSDGPLSAYVLGVPPGPPPPPLLTVTPSSLSFSGTAGGAGPASKTLSVINAGSGALPFTATDDATWLSVSPASGSAPADLTVAVNTAGLAAGTYTGTVRVESAGVSGSPKLIAVTLTVTPPQPPVLSVTPSSLAFSVVEGGAAPPSQSLAVANTGGGTLSFATSDNASWLAATPATGTAPESVSVSVNPAGLTRGTYTGSVRIDAAGATGTPATIPVTLTVTPPATGLVGAWNFNEASGTAALDSSGAGNPGTISGATRTTGRYGGGLAFDGVNDWVTVADANSLDLNRMTLEAWVRPNALGSWRTVLLKEQAGQLAYALYASADNGRPSGHVFTTGDIALEGPSVLGLTTWTHLAMTWDGSTTRLYANGSQVATAALAGNAIASNLPLRIGGNGVWGEWFNGVIDEVRVYNRALSAAEIAADRDAAIG
jgi:glucose/arabinose dehydrogenase